MGRLKKLSKLKTGLFSRNLTLAKLVGSLGKDYYFSDKKELTTRLGEALSGKVDFLQDELGQLKGSFLKAGQMLSLYAEDLLPPEVDNLLKKMQSETPFLEWDQISQQIPSHILEELEIEREAFAAASIGQVHRAKDKEGNLYALKIQYKNIDKVIDTDLRVLKYLVTVLGIIPSQIKIDNIFEEIRTMLIQEMNYEQEVQFMEQFRELVGDRYIVPKVFKQYCGPKVICSELIEAPKLGDALPSLNQESRNQLAKDFFILFFDEIFNWQMLQSDAHTGNYLVKDGKWVLLDFGATKVITKEISDIYHSVFIALARQDKEEVWNNVRKVGAINLEESNLEFLWHYFMVASEALRTEDFDWGTSDISQRVMNMSKQFQKEIKLHFVPHQTIFLDRKISGLYYMMKILGARGDIIPRSYLK